MALTAAVCFAVLRPARVAAAPAVITPSLSDVNTGGGTLALTIDGIPTQVEAHVTVSGPKYKEVAEKTQTFTHLPAGTYTITAPPIVFRDTMYGITKGSTAYANQETTTVTVTNGVTTAATVTYGTIIDARVILLTAIVTAVTAGDPENPSQITVPSDRKYTVGQILTQAHSAVLPAGLFHRVTGVRVNGASTSLTLTPSHLDEAFPQLDIADTHIDLTAPVDVAPTAPTTTAPTAPARTAAAPRSAAGEAAATASPLPPVTISYTKDLWRCQVPVANLGILQTQTFGVGFDFAFHAKKAFGIPVSPPKGRFALTLSASESLTALLPKGLGCSLNLNLDPIPGEIPVGPVLVPVYLRFGATGSLTVGTGDFTASAAAGASITAGAAFDGTHITNLSSISGFASVAASGAAKLSAGPVIRAAVGVAAVGRPDALDVHLDVKPALAFNAPVDGSCSLDAVLGSQFGVNFGPLGVNQPLPDLSHTLGRCKPATAARLAITHDGPLGAFANQKFAYTTQVTNSGNAIATGVTITETLPADGAFISSTPAGTPAGPAPGSTYTVPLPDLAPGTSATVTTVWQAPGTAGTLTSTATAHAENAADAGPATAVVPIGTSVKCNPCGATAAGTGLRNRDHGSITISGVPAGATVGRAVLVWGILYSGAQPANTIGFAGHQVSADVTSSISGNLCWGDTNTVGYAADVTSLVTGNGTYDITGPPNGVIRVDNNPQGTLPYTDGATLVVFYNGGGANNQVLSDFTYDTNTDSDNAIDRNFTGVNSTGKAASLIMAGPDGQNNFGETFTLTGNGVITLTDTWDGSDPQDGASFSIGNLWDTDTYDVTSIMGSGQSALSVHNSRTNDCIGVGATVLQVAQ
jgi:uncharacterized repeat protein (TIGR01451 family)